jgi:hypothetical protein
MLYNALNEDPNILRGAWVLYDELELPDDFEGDPEDEYFYHRFADDLLSRGLAMLRHARETQPYNQTPESASNEYRMPDNPYSLFEGLAGTVCAWSEACVAIRQRLRKLELQEEAGRRKRSHNVDAMVRECKKQELGFPFLGGNGLTGLL